MRDDSSNPARWQQPDHTVVRGPPTNGLAIASMVLGILWVYWIGSIIAVVLGHIALAQMRRNHDQGRGMAIAGLVLGYIGIGTLLILLTGIFVSG